MRNAGNLERAHSLLTLLVAGLFLLYGCARFEPKPLSPRETASQLESQTLSNAQFRSFLERNLPKTVSEWPVKNWDFEMLTLAAFYFNPSLDVARAEWRVALGGKQTAAERPNPTVTATGIYEPAAGAFSPWIPGIIFDFPVETFGKRSRRIEQAQHLSEAARFNLARAAWKVRSDVRKGLVEYAAAEKRISSLAHQVALREEMITRLNQEFQAGAISSLELNAQRLALARSRTDLADAQRLLAEARPHLAVALGLPTFAVAGLSFSFELAQLPPAQELTSRETREMALLSRSDILSALADYAASQSALQLEIAKQYPDVHLTPGYSWNAGSTGEHDWQIGVNLELPLLNQHKGAIAEASARREASAARFLALQAKVLGEIDQAVASFDAGQTNLQALDGLAAAQQNQYQAVLAQFNAGAVDRLEVLTAQIELNNLELTRVDAQLKLQQAFGALEDAVQRPLDLPAAWFESKPAKSASLHESGHVQRAN